jgi:hypothetical protein
MQTSATQTTTYHVHAINPAVVAELLNSDDAGGLPRISIDHEGGSPLRCCLQYAAPGERVALVAYEPLRRWAEATGADPGPYLERGPVFVHADGCPGYDGSVESYPGRKRRVFRRYSAAGHILGGRLVEAEEDPAAVLHELFADPETELVHVRAVEFGCFFYEAARAVQVDA